MSSSFPSLRVSMAVLSLVLASMMIGCKSDPTAPTPTVITDNDAANLFAAALGHQSGGFLMQLGDAIAIAHGAPLPASAGKNKVPSILRVTQRDTTVDRIRTVTTAGKTYAINYKVRYIYAYTSNNFNNLKDYFFPGTRNCGGRRALSAR